jgi:hypothetical protein
MLEFTIDNEYFSLDDFLKLIKFNNGTIINIFNDINISEKFI